MPGEAKKLQRRAQESESVLRRWGVRFVSDPMDRPFAYLVLILLVFGVLGAFGLMGFSADAAVQGVLITGAAVYGNQLVKQLKTE